MVIAKANQVAGDDLHWALLDARDKSDLVLPMGSNADVTVIVRLSGESAHRTFLGAGGRAVKATSLAAAEDRRAEILIEQARFAAAAAELGARRLGGVQFIDHAVVLHLPRDRLRDLARLPGVEAISAVRRFERATSTSVPLAGAPQLWSGQVGGGSFTGQGVTIAIVDDGIDYTHVHFGGAGNYADNDRTVLGDIPWPPAAAPAAMGEQLVIGGFDFVGDDYDVGKTPQPDPDPAGCPQNHGTHVAGIAAGYGVTADGATFAGDLSEGAALFPDYPLASLDAFRIGPGVAPRANLVALRVFGCEGATGTDILLQALEAAASQTFLGHDVDVVNLALGSRFGGTGADDPLNRAVQALVDLGIVVVGPAGNEGDLSLAVGTPASAPAALSVASAQDTSHQIDGEFSYLPPGEVTVVRIAAFKGEMYPAAGPDPLTAGQILADPLLACTPLVEAVAGQYQGRWVVVDRGTCPFSQKVAQVKIVGGAGVVIVNSVDGLPTLAQRAEGFDDALPTVMIGKAEGTTLKSRLLQDGVFDGTFDGSRGVAFAESPLVPAATTSRGGVLRGNGDRILKPNLAAPGVTITTASGGTERRARTASGTSMASAHVAGAAALLIEASGRPDNAAGVARIKQRLTGTATQDLHHLEFGGTPLHSPQRVGSGFVDVPAALATRLLAYASTSPENGSLSFGYPRQLTGTAPPVLEQTVTLDNLGDTPVLVDAAYAPRSTWPGAALQVTTPLVEVPAQGSASVQVRLTVAADQPNLNVSGDPLFTITSKHFLHEVSGYVTLTPRTPGAPPLRVPVYAAPHLTAATTAAAELVLPGTTGSASVSITGLGFDYGSDIDDHASMVSAYTLLANPVPKRGVGRGGARLRKARKGTMLGDRAVAEIDYLGAELFPVTSDVTTVALGLKTRGEWNSPSDLHVEIEVDVDFDGEYDYRWFYAPRSANFPMQVAFLPENLLLSPDPPAYQLNLSPGWFRDTMLFKNNVMTLPIAVKHPFIAAQVPARPSYQDGPIGLRVSTYLRDEGLVEPVDSVAVTYDPRVRFKDGTFRNYYRATAGKLLPFDFDFVGAGDLPAVLTLHHHHDDPAARAQITQLTLPAPPEGDAIFEDGFEPPPP